MKTKFFLFPFAFLIAAASAANAPYTGDTWNLLDSKKEMAAAADITQAKYPDCDQATVDKKMVRVYRQDGTGECQDESFIKVLTEKGKRENRTLTLSFMLPYDTVEVTTLEVISPDGTVTPVDVAANSKVSIDDSQMSMNIYDPNSKILQVNLPKLEIGDVVHSVARTTITRAFMPGQYAEENTFEDEGMIRHALFEVHCPSDRPLERVALRDEVNGTVKQTKESGPDNTVVRRWEFTGVPRMFEEPAMPPGLNCLQRLVVSTTPDWQTVSKWYWDLSLPHLQATTADMTNEVNELVAGAKTDMDKIKAVFYYVSKDIRYAGQTPETNRPGFEPHDVCLTYSTKNGVCRDKAALLVSLLRTAGLTSYPVLINVGTKMDQDVPDPFFNHAIVSVELSKGKYILMDPTDEHTRELLPSYDCDQTYLVCRPGGEDLKTSAVEPPEAHMMEIKTTGELKADGHLEAKSELFFGGVNDDEYRNAFSHMKADDQRRFFERDIKNAMPGARLTSFKLLPEDMMDVSTPLRATLEYSVDGMTTTGSGKSMISLPWIGNNFGIVNFILGGTGLDKRKYPMQTMFTCGVKEDVALKMDGGFTGAISMPTCPVIHDDCLNYDEAVAYKDGSLDCSRDLKLKVVEFSPKQYATLKKTLKSMEYDARKVPVLTVSETAATDPAAKPAPPAPPVESDAKILESHKELQLTGAHDGVYRVHYKKEILNYAGKIREAEVKVGYNPSCEEARVIHGIVISKTGQKQELATNEIHSMDAGWNASAKRYTGGKILVANLPGVDIGSTIDVEFEIKTKGKPFLAGYESFQLRDALDKKSFDLTAPESLPVKEMITGKQGVVKEEKSSRDGMSVYNWQSENVGAQPAEGRVPPDWAYNEGVAWFAGDMSDYLSTLNAALLDRSSKNAKVAEMTAKLVGESKTPLDKITAIRDFVAKSIREAGPSFSELPLGELSAADTTLADGYGHAADHAILLHAMLTAAGFKPEFVLASGLPSISGITNVSLSFPLPNYFESPLVRVEVEGIQYYLNDGDQYSKLGATSYDGRQALVLSTGAHEIIHAAPGCEDKSETVYTLSISDKGETRVGVTRHFYGDTFGSVNKYYSELPPEERRRHFQEMVSGVAQGARAVGDLKTSFDTYPGSEQFTVDVDNYSVVDGKYLYFDLPFTPSLVAAGADQRTLPLYLTSSEHNTIRAEIELPPAYHHAVIAPRSRTLDVPDGGGSAKIVATETPGKFLVSDEFDTEPAIIAARDYPSVLKLESTLEQKSSKAFLFSAEP